MHNRSLCHRVLAEGRRKEHAFPFVRFRTVAAYIGQSPTYHVALSTAKCRTCVMRGWKPRCSTFGNAGIWGRFAQGTSVKGKRDTRAVEDTC